MKAFTIKDIAAWMDGGSLTLDCLSADGDNLEIEIVQHIALNQIINSRIPGRLYLNNELVEIRSKLEKSILNELINCIDSKDFSSKFTDIERRLIKEKVEFIQSDDYLLISKEAANVKK